MAGAVAVQQWLANTLSAPGFAGHDPFEVWRLPKPEALALLPATSLAGGAIRAFFQAARTYYPTEQSIEEGLQVIATGMASLQAAHGW